MDSSHAEPSVPRPGSRERRELQLETLYELLVGLHSHRSEQDLVDDLLQRVCAVVDPTAAAAATRDIAGRSRALATVGFIEPPSAADELFREPIWQELRAGSGPLARRNGRLLEQSFRELLAVPLEFRGTPLGYLVLLDKEVRGESDSRFSEEDRRFVSSLGLLAGVVLDSVRQVESLKDRSARLEEENKLLKEHLEHEVAGQRIIAEAAPMRKVLEVAERVAPRGINVLVRGESGTGKELIARLLHQRSERPGPIVAVNCAALPESLLESELFGIEGGVATGVRARLGKFELADRGTLFLDEIGDLDLALQVRLLRSLQEREIVRVGGQQPVKVDVRLVAATHQQLEDLVAKGAFREDLYYRLKGVEIWLPPLRERREDVPRLVRYFLRRFCEREGIEEPIIERSAWDLLLGHEYSGNVRELQSLVEGSASLAVGTIDAALLSSLAPPTTVRSGPEPLDLASLEARHIGRVLKMTSGNKSAAARLLGVDRRTLSRKGY